MNLPVSLGLNRNYVSGYALPAMVMVNTKKSRDLPLRISKFPWKICQCVPTLSGSMGTSRIVITELCYKNRQGIRVFRFIRQVLLTIVKLKKTHELPSKINLYCNLLETQTNGNYIYHIL